MSGLKSNGGSGFAMGGGDGHSWDQVVPGNGAGWDQANSDEQYNQHPFVGENPPLSGVPFNSGDTEGDLRLA